MLMPTLMPMLILATTYQSLPPATGLSDPNAAHHDLHRSLTPTLVRANADARSQSQPKSQPQSAHSLAIACRLTAVCITQVRSAHRRVG